MSAARAIARRTLADARGRNLGYALLFALVALVQVVGYRHSFPTMKDRLAFAAGFGDNKAVRLFYGVPHDLLTVGGYAAWRVGGVLSIFAGLWGVLAATRALRGEEDAGRQELVLAGVVTRRSAYLAALTGIGGGIAILWLALFAGLAAGRLPAGPSGFLALATVSAAAVFTGVGALASQLAPTRRLALGLSTGALVLALVVRVVADTTSSLTWLRWATPLGWVEELRPFAGPRPALLVLPLAATAFLLLAAGLISVRRDVGAGLIASSDSSPPRLGLLGSPVAQAFRGERAILAAWLAGIGFFALIFGLLSKSFNSTSIPENLQERLRKIGGAAITTPAGALGFYFLFFVLACSLFACSQIAGVRREEDDQRLETLFALPVGRRGWLAGRLGLATAATAALALAAGVFAWVGAVSQGADVSLGALLEAGANCLPAALLFLGLGALAFAGLPRASTFVAYGLVSVAFLWELFGAFLGAPGWTLGISPFHHVGLIPAQPFRAVSAAVMLGVAVAAAIGAVQIFARRDLAGS